MELDTREQQSGSTFLNYCSKKKISWAKKHFPLNTIIKVFVLRGLLNGYIIKWLTAKLLSAFLSYGLLVTYIIGRPENHQKRVYFQRDDVTLWKCL